MSYYRDADGDVRYVEGTGEYGLVLAGRRRVPALRTGTGGVIRWLRPDGRAVLCQAKVARTFVSTTLTDDEALAWELGVSS